jgi:hypothetical protein
MDDPVARSSKQDRLVDGGKEPPADGRAEAPDSVPIGPLLPQDDGDITFGGGGVTDIGELAPALPEMQKPETVTPEDQPLQTSEEFDSTTLDDVVVTEQSLDGLDAADSTTPAAGRSIEQPSYPLSSSGQILPDNSEPDFLIY